MKGAIAQYWGYDRTGAAERKQVADATKNGTKLVLSPADRTYLDMKYTKETKLGLSWAGYVEVQRSYDWNPAAYLEGVPAASAGRGTGMVARGHARLGHLQGAPTAAQGPRLSALGIDFYRSPQVPWRTE